MARMRHLNRAGVQLSLSWPLRNGVARARHLGRAAPPPKENFLIKKGGRGRSMQRVRPREQLSTKLLSDAPTSGDAFKSSSSVELLDVVEGGLWLSTNGFPNSSLLMRQIFTIHNNPTSVLDQVVPLKSGLSFPRGKEH
ncbi:hypothetical protein PIB30_090612 [Stylosanthes scabra]|uniref:Uncharacterized protein n=1 Tax=Stylosanthes scabra TaxID=79078 RepID=A0ABU6WVL9_9FABA|nr:hypothetical protein [Stylosanthes scabra]